MVQISLYLILFHLVDQLDKRMRSWSSQQNTHNEKSGLV